MILNSDPKINVNILNQPDFLNDKTYNVVTVKPNKIGDSNVLIEGMLSTPNTKYVIIYNFTLNGQTVHIGENCILEINGGNISNGELVGNNTIVINTNGVEILQDLITLSGTWKNNNLQDWDIVYLTPNELRYLNVEDRWFVKKGTKTSGEEVGYIFVVFNNVFYNLRSPITTKGLVIENTVVTETNNYDITNLPEIAQEHSLPYRKENGKFIITLPDGTDFSDLQTTRKWKYDKDFLTYGNAIPTLTLSMLSLPNKKYIVNQEYIVLEPITMPENCTLVLAGGNIVAGTITGTNTVLLNPYHKDVHFIAEGDKGWIFTEYFHEILSEEDFENLDLKRSDTIYFIVES